MVTDVKAPVRTAKQIVNKDGTPLASALTSNLWIGSPTAFSIPTEGNSIVAFTTGQEYFADLIASCDAAENEIFITGWQVNWDALLAPGVRLYDVLLRAAKRNIKICVMPWNDTNPVQTYDDQTKIVLECINDHPGVQPGTVQVMLSKSFETKNGYYSHHQKLVVIDRTKAYIGGIDLAYGRYDDATYDLLADKDGRQMLNRYNGCITWTLQVSPNGKLANPDMLSGPADNFSVPFLTTSTAKNEIAKIDAGAFQTPYAKANGAETATNTNWLEETLDLHTLDPKCQPRMPWQDLHSRIEGPAVSPLARNFILRWNACGGERLPLPAPAERYKKKGTAFIQVLRSAPAAMGMAEYNSRILKSGVKAPAGTESDIHRAMISLIEKSRHFVYIENQFFVSAFGQRSDSTANLSPAAQFIKTGPGGIGEKVLGIVRFNYNSDTKPNDLDSPPTNQVCSALIARIQRAILDRAGPNFHVYITLPVHSEGQLTDATIAVQVYWTMQTLVFGSKSLLNGIRRALKVRELTKIDDAAHLCRDHSHILNDDANREYESIPVEDCFEYVTLLNLRNWAKLPGRGSGDERYVTEQIYVHTKLMIVDDLYALFGSANINDRSLLGERDSEIAVLVMDGENKRADINGKGSQRPVRVFAHELRMNIWKKIFGITGGVRPASDLLSAIEAPGIPDSWRRIQAQAARNAELYEAAFPYVPRNWTGRTRPDGSPEPAAILPTWNASAEPPKKAKWQRGNLAAPMPSQPEFWSLPRHIAAAVDGLDRVKGFFTALPIFWSAGENNRIEFPTPLVAENDLPPQRQEGARATQTAQLERAKTPNSQRGSA